MNNILVTGGAGFIGFHLCKTLLDRGDKVICIDNLYTGSKNNINLLSAYKDFKFIQHDIIYPLEFINLDCNIIYNLACPASPNHYQKNPINTLKTSVYGAVNILEIAKVNNAKVFQASTSEVYGDPLIHPQKESHWGNVNPNGVRACYDEGKRCAEALFFDYHRNYNIDIKVARIFNTYGPYMDIHDGRVVSNFIIQALQGKPITIYGDGTQTRSFCYIDDMVKGIIKLTDSNEIGPINLGNPNEFTVAQLAQKIRDLTTTESEIIFKTLPKDDPKQRKPDIGLAINKLGWRPEVELEEGLIKTISYFKTLIN